MSNTSGTTKSPAIILIVIVIALFYSIEGSFVKDILYFSIADLT